MRNSILIVGSGLGLSAAHNRLRASDGMTVAMAACDIAKLETVVADTRASLHQCDASDADEGVRLFADLDDMLGSPELVDYNPSAWVKGPIQGLNTEITKQTLNTTFYGVLWWRSKPPNGCKSKAMVAFFSPAQRLG